MFGGENVINDSIGCIVEVDIFLYIIVSDACDVYVAVTIEVLQLEADKRRVFLFVFDVLIIGWDELSWKCR